MVNLYEAARLKGVKRIVFASSNHVTGFYRQDEVVNTRMPPKPDGFYGLSKAFGEDLAQLYWDRWGIETVSIRIGSSFSEPKDRRMLATYLSYDDLERLIVAALTAPIVGHSIIYGMSDNQTTWWDNTHAKHIGYRPQDSSDVFRSAVEARQPVIDTKDPAAIYAARISTAAHGVSSSPIRKPHEHPARLPEMPRRIHLRRWQPVDLPQLRARMEPRRSRCR
jgi:uronate dehydrogenase